MFCGGLRDTTTEDELQEKFLEYGNIEKIDLIKDKETDKSRGFAFVTYEDYDSVDRVTSKLACIRYCMCTYFSVLTVMSTRTVAKG